MKIKKILSLICCLTLCLLTINFTCYAESEIDGSSFYVTGEKLDQIFEALQDDSYEYKI